MSTYDNPPIEGTPSAITSAIHTGTNIVGIVSDGRKITLFVNHILVHSISGTYTNLSSLKLQNMFGEDIYSNARLWSL